KIHLHRETAQTTSETQERGEACNGWEKLRLCCADFDEAEARRAVGVEECDELAVLEVLGVSADLQVSNSTSTSPASASASPCSASPSAVSPVWCTAASTSTSASSSVHPS